MTASSSSILITLDSIVVAMSHRECQSEKKKVFFRRRSADEEFSLFSTYLQQGLPSVLSF